MGAPASPSPVHPDPPARLLRVREIWAEPAALDPPRGRDVVARFPGAQVVEVPSHWRIPELHANEGNVERWVRVKTETLVLGVEKSLTAPERALGGPDRAVERQQLRDGLRLLLRAPA